LGKEMAGRVEEEGKKRDDRAEAAKVDSRL
jgi:hypothetical protein